MNALTMAMLNAGLVQPDETPEAIAQAKVARKREQKLRYQRDVKVSAIVKARKQKKRRSHLVAQVQDINAKLSK